MVKSKNIYTFLGLLAVIFWATSSAASIKIVAALGPLTTVSFLSGTAGLILLTFEIIKNRSVIKVFNIGKHFALAGGLLFILYEMFYIWALYICPTRETSSQVNIINYLWPFFLIIFSIPILKAKPACLKLSIAILASMAGIFIAAGNDLSISSAITNIRHAWMPFALMFLAAVSWGLYSVLAKKLHLPENTNATPVFFLVLFIVSMFARIFIKENTSWSNSLIPLILYNAIFPNAIAYLFWEMGSKKGDIILIGAFSYALPFLSTLFIGLFLHTHLYLNLIIGVIITSIGAILTQKSIVLKE